MEKERLVINCAHSPDSDDAFMYYGIACGAVDTGRFIFRQVMNDIQSLNEQAKERKYEITAISFAAYPEIKNDYLLMPCGASFGLNYGPLVVCRKNGKYPILNNVEVAVPGYMTTAYLLLRLYEPNVKVTVMPFEQIIPAVEKGVVEAGLIIHEGQLTHDQFGLQKLVDLGQWWAKQTGLPLPLGGNAIKRNLGDEQIIELTKILKESVQYGLSNREAALKYALDFARGMSPAIVDEYIKMYVNDLSIDCGDLGRSAVKQLFSLANEARVLDEQFVAEFVS